MISGKVDMFAPPPGSWIPQCHDYVCERENDDDDDDNDEIAYFCVS